MDKESLNKYVRFVLLAGMVLSVSTMAIGLLMYALNPHGWAEVSLSLEEIAEGLTEGNPIAVIDLGIILLIATPLVRTMTALGAFAASREMKFVAVSLIVLFVIVLAVLTGAT
ncbi:MAG: DUF1634 domain-containing protein [Euryarchaeota archaeon]|nr:DUF1634 domain-containing protein [Euryarchaeota archaeon]